MKTQSFYITYDGPALASHEMEVRELAPALLALSDLFEETNAVLNGTKAKITLNIKGSFKTGCIGIDLTVVQNLLHSLVSFASKTEVTSAATILTILGFNAKDLSKGLINVLRRIRGRKISRIELKDSNVTIFIGDDFFQTEESVLKLLKNAKIRRALEDVIFKPLSRDGIDSFGFAENATETAHQIKKEEANYYIAPPVESEDLGTTEREVNLQLIGITFLENNKWRFSDGISTFFADMNDKDFLTQIDRHEVFFCKGDILRAKIRETTNLLPSGTLSTERVVLKVLEHRNTAVQLKLTDL